jgi:hypothetical protein
MQSRISSVIFILACAPLSAAPDSRGFEIQLSQQLLHDDNLYRLPDAIPIRVVLPEEEASRDDLVSRTSLAVGGDWVLGAQRFAARAGADLNRFSNNAWLDNTSASGSAAWDWTLTRRWSGRFAADYQRALSSFGNNRALERDVFETLAYSGELRFRLLARWYAMGTLHHSETLHEDESRTVDDVRTTSGSVGLEYRTSEDDRVILEYRFADARFPHPGLLAGVPFNRDYDEDGARLGVRYAFSAKTSLQASFGYLRRDYPLGRTGDFSGNVWNASLQWLPGIKTQVTVSGWSELKAYLDAESDHFVAEGGRAEVRWAPTRKLAFSLAYSQEDQEYVSESSGVTVASGRRDQVRSPQASFSYAVSDTLLLELSWRLEERESNVLPFDYDDRIALVAFRLAF